MAGSRDRTSWREIHRLATQGSRRVELNYASQGVAVLATNSVALAIFLQAALLAGQPFTVLQPPARLDSASLFVQRVQRQLAESGAQVVVVSREHLESAQSLRGVQVFSLEAEIASFAGLNASKPRQLPEETVAVRHFTSGTTSEARVVGLTHANLAASFLATKIASAHDYIHDVLLSWLPLSHDMGLFGFLLLPMTCGRCELVLGDPSRFLRSPVSWMSDVDRYGATGTAAPNFAYSLAAKLMNGAAPNLSTLRFCLCGGERISPEAIHRFVETGKPLGLADTSMVAAYGLAEATLAVCMSPVGSGIEFVSHEVLGREHHLADLGTPIPGVSIEIGSSSSTTPEGEVLVRGEPVSKEALSSTGRLHTGDNGLIIDGSLVLTGRIKEIIIRGGQNYYPEDFESTLMSVPRVKPGGLVVFSKPLDSGTETIVVIVESSSPLREQEDLRESIRRKLKLEHGLAAEVICVPPRSIPKTSSGKLQRGLAISLFSERLSS